MRIDANTIKAKYDAMSDRQLLSFAEEEGHQLTGEAMLLLRRVLKSRQLDETILHGIKNTEFSKKAGHIKDSVENLFTDFSKEHWLYVFDEKEEGKSNIEIINGLVETGMNEEHAIRLINTLETRVKPLLKNAETEKLSGGFIFLSGIAITYLPISMTTHRLVFIIAWCAIFFGSGKIIKALYYKSKYKAILKNINSEKKL